MRRRVTPQRGPRSGGFEGGSETPPPRGSKRGGFRGVPRGGPRGVSGGPRGAPAGPPRARGPDPGNGRVELRHQHLSRLGELLNTLENVHPPRGGSGGGSRGPPWRGGPRGPLRDPSPGGLGRTPGPPSWAPRSGDRRGDPSGDPPPATRVWGNSDGSQSLVPSQGYNQLRVPYRVSLLVCASRDFPCGSAASRHIGDR